MYQEVNLLPNRSVAENLFLGHQPTRFGLVRKGLIEARARDVLATYGLEIDVKADLGTYSVAIQQIVAIARAVQLSGKVLVLDEPTASLDRNEVTKMFEVVARLKARGLAIIFITHFLDQVFAIADRVTILRNGRKVGTERLSDLTATDVVRMMLGKDIAFSHHAGALSVAATGPARVEFKGVGKAGKVAPFTLRLHEGEVVGVAGLLGSGRTEMARLMFGVDQPDTGAITVAGQPDHDPQPGAGRGSRLRLLPRRSQARRHLRRAFGAREHHHRAAGQAGMVQRAEPRRAGPRSQAATPRRSTSARPITTCRSSFCLAATSRR